MNDTQKNARNLKPKTSKFAIASVLLGVLGFIILPFAMVKHYPPGTDVSFLNVAGVVGIFGLLLSIAAIIRIKNATALLRSVVFATVGVVLTFQVSAIWLFKQIQLSRPQSTAYRVPGRSNLKQLGLAMAVYAHDNDTGQYPEPNKWCDVLIKQGRVNADHFIYPSIIIRKPFIGETMFTWPKPKNGISHFAMNANFKSNSPADVVLLFEAKEGWNQSGGAELLTAHRHHGEGGHVLYRDGNIHLVTDPTKLNWGDKEKQ